MKSFKEYSSRPDNLGNDQPDNAKTAGFSGTSTAAELTKKIAAAYNGKSGAEMLSGILAEAERSKRAGTLSNAEIDAFYEQFAPMLGPVQKRKLKSVVEKLKKL